MKLSKAFLIASTLFYEINIDCSMGDFLANLHPPPPLPMHALLSILPERLTIKLLLKISYLTTLSVLFAIVEDIRRSFL